MAKELIKNSKVTKEKVTLKKGSEKASILSGVRAIKLDGVKNWFGAHSRLVKVVIYIVLFVLILLGVDYFIQYLNNGYSIAVVNGERITRSAYVDRLEEASGDTTASDLIDEALIEQEAAKDGYSVTTAEVDAKISDIQTRLGGADALNTALKQNNITMQMLRDQYRIDILTQKILEPTLKITDANIQAFFDQYKTSIYPNETNAKLSDHADEVRSIYISQLISQQRTSWLEGLRSAAKIQNNRTTTPVYSPFQVTRNIIQNLLDRVTKK